MNILIVDDNAQVRETIKKILDNPGVRYFECDDGAKALELYRQIRPAWVLMDIMMPGLNGIQASQDIIAEYPDARIAIVTNFDDKEYRAAAKEAGAKAYILKEEMTKLRDLCALDESKENLF
jgi:two-component system, NarL family, response regulator DegU